ADVHVRRVFARLGLCPSGATIEQLVYKARALHPEFPGMMDLPSWEIGRKWCRPRRPDCGTCYMRDLCPTATAGRRAKRGRAVAHAMALESVARDVAMVRRTSRRAGAWVGGHMLDDLLHHADQHLLGAGPA